MTLLGGTFWITWVRGGLPRFARSDSSFEFRSSVVERDGHSQTRSYVTAPLHRLPRQAQRLIPDAYLGLALCRITSTGQRARCSTRSVTLPMSRS